MRRIELFENEYISTEMAKAICEDLHKDRLEMLSFRKCTMTDKDFKKMIRAVVKCQSLRHLGLNIGVVADSFRAQVLAQMLQKNSSLVGLYLHGSTINDADMTTLVAHIKRHPRITHLDIGDCRIGDDGLAAICDVIKDNQIAQGLHELVLSHNPNITSEGWTKFGMALASGSCLRTLDIDYNDIGDTVGCCLATALPGASQLEYLDMECTSITEQTGQVFLHLVKSCKLKLKTINIKRNRVCKSTIEAIKLHLADTEEVRSNVRDIDAQSLALSEPPMIEYNQLDDFELDTIQVPVVDVMPADNEDIIQPLNSLRVPQMVLGSKSMVYLNDIKDNTEQYAMKKAFSLNDISGTKRGEMKDGKNNFEECEAYFPDKEVVKRTNSSEIDITEDVEEESLVDLITIGSRRSVDECAVYPADERSVASNAGNVSPLFRARPMSAPTSRNGVLQRNDLFQ